MKIQILAFLVGIVVFASCKDAEKEKLIQEKAELERQMTQMKEEGKLVRGEYSEAIETLNSIEDTLRAISDREREIQKLSQSKELNGTMTQRENIVAKLEALKQANQQANQQAKQLQSKVSNLNVENQQLRKMIADKETKILEKERQIQEQATVIGDLRTALNKMEAQLLETKGELAVAYEDLKRKNDDLTQTNSQLQKTIEELQQKSSFIETQAQAYVVCGTKKELRKQNIMQDLAYQLTKDYKKQVISKGSKVSFYENTDFQCGAEGGNIADVLPKRDPSSYQIQGAKLIIKNAQVFWATDKVVVLVKEKD